MTASENLVTQNEKATELNLISASASHAIDNKHDCKKIKFNKFLFEKIASKEIGGNSITISSDENIFLIQFCLTGSSSVYRSSQKKPITFKQAEYNILLLPKEETTTLINTEDCDLIQIYLEEKFFLQYLSRDYGVPLYNLIGIGKLFHNHLYLNPKLKSILAEIENCDFVGNLKNLYTKAKIIELLSLQLAQYEEEKITPTKLKPLEVEKMILVKEIIEGNIGAAHSISSLARAAGTNEQYLKKHFKLLFGTTVFGYIVSCKMEKAKKMLLTGEYRITEISEVVGYKHATHFTNAFKKFFGYLPQSLKASKIILGTFFSMGIKLEAMELMMI
ncbi:helix-turn-helix domain-containing protein [Pedobacter sp. SL55]|uniref:helix-turn-helix domain-containing protein n=1 Tax=Pedobacter sp. SL55 TaxID=2995161 RepID=UPI00227164F3|nr:AraC family transcriptional regulator [Pedobacter sp. SL55]WAC42279.1 AraC family transcriptional regulator [Pedobacter sp. SL55]